MVVILISGNTDILCGHFRRINSHITGADEFTVLSHTVASLTNLTVFFKRSVASSDIPPYISIKTAHNKTVMNILGYFKSLWVSICIGAAVGNVNFCHPEFFSAVFDSREIHLISLCSVEVSTEKVGICKSLRIAENRIIYILAVLETLRRHKLCLSACGNCLSVLSDKACQICGSPVSPVLCIVRFILNGN